MKPRKSWREKLADSKGLPKFDKTLKRGQRYFVADFEKTLAFTRG